MNILGIIGFGENPAACLLQDGKMVAFVAEERLTRLKGSHGMFPSKAVEYCLSYAKLNLSDISRIAFGWDARKYPWKIVQNFGVNYFKYKPREASAFHKTKDKSSIFNALAPIIEFIPSGLDLKIRDGLRAAGLKGDIPKIEYVPHHLAHAYSSYFCSGFDQAGILTLDGSGEEICTQLAIAKGDQISVIESVPIPHSLGWFYAAITQYLGFIPYRDEGKLMGLAALGEERATNNKWIEPLSKILQIGNGSYQVDPIYTKFGGHYYADRFTDELVKLLTSIDKNAEPISYGEKVNIDGKAQSKYLLPLYVDIAFAAQDLIEKAAVMLAKKLVNQYKVENICVAGGVGLNCKMNGEILRQSGCKNIFVQPASSDDGTALGAAMYVAKQMGEKINHKLTHAQYGPGYTNDQIEAALKTCKISYKRIDDPAEVGGKLLVEGKLLSWFQGRMEFGARALGGRSILANGTSPGVKEKVNAEVKYRENWRPFCPSLIEEYKDKYLVDANEAAFMIVAYHGSDLLKKNVPGVVHVDGTIRPQAINKEVNPLYHSLVSNVGKATGHPIILNTSFNIRSEPIINTPLEAVRCFYSSGLDALIMGNFLLTKN